MLEMEIREKGCRGCRFCADICPTEAIAFDDETQKAVVKSVEDPESIASEDRAGAVEHRRAERGVAARQSREPLGALFDFLPAIERPSLRDASVALCQNST